jgi:MFS family permease
MVGSVVDAGDSEPDSPTPAERRALTRVSSDRARIATLAGTGLVVAFMQTVVTPIIPHLPEYLATNPADASWVLTATLLAATVCTPISGRLGDMYGKRRVLIGILVIVIIGNVIAGFSNELLPMIVARALQGVGLGAIALGISIMRDVLHPKNLGGAVALMSATLGVGGAVGLPVAAIIAQNFDWHLLFVLGGVLAAVALVLVARVIPVSTLRSGGRFDALGALGLAVGLIGVLLAISKGAEWGWSSPVTIALAAGGLVVLVAWGGYELRVRDPLVDLRVAVRRPVLLTNLASITVGFSFFVATAALPVLLELPRGGEVGLGLDLFTASLCLMPLGLVMFLVSSPAARPTAARGPRTSLLLGIGVIAVAFTLGSVLLDEIWHVILVSTVTGVGIGFAYAAMPTLIMRSVPPSETAAANGLNAVMRTLGSSFSATLVGVILAAGAVTQGAVAAPSRMAFTWVFIMGVGVALAGFVLALFIPRRWRSADTASIPVQE